MSRDGCAALVHHLETVAWLVPIVSASHLFVRLFSAKTIFNLFKSSFCIMESHYMGAKIQNRPDALKKLEIYFLFRNTNIYIELFANSAYIFARLITNEITD